jgi:hypothetical protein
MTSIYCISCVLLDLIFFDAEKNTCICKKCFFKYDIRDISRSMEMDLLVSILQCIDTLRVQSLTYPRPTIPSKASWRQIKPLKRFVYAHVSPYSYEAAAATQPRTEPHALGIVTRSRDSNQAMQCEGSSTHAVGERSFQGLDYMAIN